MLRLTAASARLERLRDRIAGRVVVPDDPGYDEVRSVWNGAVDHRPRVIVQCTGVADVMGALDFARGEDLRIGVRGGGHNVFGSAVPDEGLMIDLSRLRSVRVDPGARRAWADPGARVGDLDRECQNFGLATPVGISSDVGVAGLTLGGGLGWLGSRFGLSCDNLTSAEVVTADGSLLTASEDENPDLFWALRGGGGNFGIVTSFELRLHPLGRVLAGPVIYGREDAAEVLRAYRDYEAEAPDELLAYAGLMPDPDGNPVTLISACYSGEDLKRGTEVVAPLRSLAEPLADRLGPTSFVELQQAFDAAQPPGHEHAERWEYLSGLSDDVIELVVDHGAEWPPTAGVLLVHQHGAATRVAPDATAFVHRDPAYQLGTLLDGADSRQGSAASASAEKLWEALAPFLRGVYGNQVEPGAGREADVYGQNLERLRQIKARYDPDNVFNLNANITPA